MTFNFTWKSSVMLALSMLFATMMEAKEERKSIGTEANGMKVKVEFYSPEIVRIVKQPA
ncbi:MAG: hypothetical protein II806_04015 [Bacteroidaceae bacterium]|nr:hypothetical protein [Bacteroidaceae bacterium]